LIGSDQCSVTLFDLRVPAWASAAALNSSPNSSPQLKESYVDTLKGHEFWITDIKPASDDRHIATSSADGQIKVWDIRGRPTRSIVWQIKEEKPVWSLCWKAGSGAASFVTGSGGVDGRQASGNVRWYQVSGTGT
jgi:WD40 repeat protein